MGLLARVNGIPGLIRFPIASGMARRGSSSGRGLAGCGQGSLAAAVSSDAARRTAAPVCSARADADKGSKGQKGSILQGTSFPLGRPQSSAVVVTQTMKGGRKPGLRQIIVRFRNL